jgi:ribosomal protein S11
MKGNTMAVKENYPAELVAQIRARYEELGNAGLETIATEIGKTKRSVISKLVREGVYIADAPAPKAAKVEGPTKKELLRDLEAAGFNVEGLEPATKDAIARVLAFSVALTRETEQAA